MPDIHLPSILLKVPRNSVTALGLPLALGLISSSATTNLITLRSQWFRDLKVPPGRPPKQILPVVWSILYLSAGYASHLAVKSLDTAVSPSSRSDLTLGIALYYAQFGMNLLFSPIFFGTRRTDWAFVDSVLLAGTTCYMTKLLDGPTGSKTTPFLVPYCLWLTFASYLSGGIWWLNRGSA